MNKILWLVVSCVVSSMVGLATLSIARGAVPKRVTNDTVLYQKLSDIRVERQKELSFDHDIARLASLEKRYRENLPLKSLKRHSRIQEPLKRVSNKPYRYSGHTRVR